jgi:hypothetical protein
MGVLGSLKVSAVAGCSVHCNSFATTRLGRFNFWCVAGGRFDLQSDYSGVKQKHYFSATGHGSGVVDVIGKAAKMYLNSLSNFKK